MISISLEQEHGIMLKKAEMILTNQKILKLSLNVLRVESLHKWKTQKPPLRRGFATEAARLGASMPAIQKHGR